MSLLRLRFYPISRKGSKVNTAGGAIFRGHFEQGLAEGPGELQVYFSAGIVTKCTFTFIM